MPYKPNWNVVCAESSDCRDQLDGRLVESDKTEFPDDLQAVANQLTDDAQHLESQFPARLVSPALVASTGSFCTAPWRRAAAAVLLIGVGAGGAMVAQHFMSSRGAAAVDRRATLVAEPPDKSTPSNPAGVQEVSFDRAAPRAKLTEVEMLRIQLDAFEKVIRKLQDELTARQNSEAQTTQLVELLRHEIDNLRIQLDDSDRAQAK